MNCFNFAKNCILQSRVIGLKNYCNFSKKLPHSKAKFLTHYNNIVKYNKQKTAKIVPCTILIYRTTTRDFCLYLTSRFGVGKNQGKSIRGGDTLRFAQCGRHSRRRCLSLTFQPLLAAPKALTECCCIQVSNSPPDCLKLLFLGTPCPNRCKIAAEHVAKRDL